VAADSQDLRARRTAALAHEKLGDVKAWTGDVRGAVADAREALRHWGHLAGVQPGSAAARLSYAISTTKLGDLLGHPAFPNLGDRAEAERQYRHALALLEAGGADSAGDWGRRRQIALDHERLGAMLQLDDRWDEALAAFERSLVLRQELSREDPTSTNAARDVAVSREGLCRTHLAGGDLGAAMSQCSEAVGLYRSLRAADSGNAQGVSDLALAQGAVSQVLAARGRWSAALSELDESTRLLRQFLRANPGNLPARRELARHLLRSSVAHARLASSGGADQRLRHRDLAKALYAGGLRAFSESAGPGRSVEDQGDERLAREALAQLDR